MPHNPIADTDINIFYAVVSITSGRPIYQGHSALQAAEALDPGTVWARSLLNATCALTTAQHNAEQARAVPPWPLAIKDQIDAIGDKYLKKYHEKAGAA